MQPRWWHSTVVEVHADAHHCHVEERMQCFGGARLSLLACLLALWESTGRGLPEGIEVCSGKTGWLLHVP